mmetsp:Transcript_35668/g.72700  ORF Transcript_35668/g.72700 Transcript_35668/m.72700 type:complete len:411 (-) Transcript_35668:102-1334(-)
MLAYFASLLHEKPGADKEETTAAADDDCSKEETKPPSTQCVVCFETIHIYDNSSLKSELPALCCFQTSIEEATHATCGSCIRSWLVSELRENTLQFRCPNFECSRLLDDSEVKPSIGAQNFVLLQTMRQTRELDSNPLTRWCPSPACGAVVWRKNVKQKCMECPTCNGKVRARAEGWAARKRVRSASFCADCGEVWSTGHTLRCGGEAKAVRKWATGQRRLSFRGSGRSSTNVGGDAVSGESARILSPLLACCCGELQSQRCPGCRARVEKSGGCNHIVCWSCRAEWCWLCAKPFAEGHFNDPLNGCPGMQHSRVNVWGRHPSVRVATKTIGGIVFISVGLGVAAVATALAIASAPLLVLGYGASRATGAKGCGRRRVQTNTKASRTQPKKEGGNREELNITPIRIPRPI